MSHTAHRFFGALHCFFGALHRFFGALFLRGARVMFAPRDVVH